MGSSMTRDQARAMSIAIVVAKTMPSLFNDFTRVQDVLDAAEDICPESECLTSIQESTIRDLFEYVESGGSSPDDIHQQIAIYKHIWEGELMPDMDISPDNSLGFPIEHTVDPSANLIVFLRWLVDTTTMNRSDVQDVRVTRVDDDFRQSRGGVRVSFTTSWHILGRLRGGHAQLEKLLEDENDSERAVSISSPIQHAVVLSASPIVFLRQLADITNMIPSDIQDVRVTRVDDDFQQGRGGIGISFTTSWHILGKMRGGHAQLQELLDMEDDS